MKLDVLAMARAAARQRSNANMVLRVWVHAAILEGFTQRRIAEETGLALSTVNRWAREHAAMQRDGSA